MSADPRRVKELFVAALDLTDEQSRRQFLDRECAGDAELRRRLEMLLHAHERPQPALDQPLAAVAPPQGQTGPATHSPAAATEEQAGTLLAGKYKLVERIGEGGMGSVWMAQQTEPVKRMVAIKLIKGAGDARAVLARFEAERQALALMDHPNIAKVLDGGTTETGRPFFVMELVKGVPITTFCDTRKLTPRQRLELFIPVCQAIQHAHQKGVIHRDVKPSNVLVALYDDKPVPKVIDFGLAKATGAELTERSLHTGFGAIVGTPQYMSPEQATLNNLDIDTRSDIYSLGVLLYELLTGSPPFRRKELEKAGMLEVLRVIREEEPPKPSTKVNTANALPSLAANRGTEPAKLTRLLRGEIDWMVMKALEKERSRRYETANGFAMDIQRYLADEPVQAGPPSAWYRLRKFVKRNKGRVVASALILLALLAGMAGTTWGLIRAETARQAEAERAEGERLAKLDAEKAAEAEAKAKVKAQEAAEAEKKAKEQAQKRLKQIEKGIEILASVFHDLNPRSEEKEGESLRALLGKRLGEAVKQLEGEAVGNPVVVAQLQGRLGNSLGELGHYGQAETVLTKARRTLEASLGADHPETLMTKNNLAALYKSQGKYAAAEALFKEVIQRRTARLGADHPDNLTPKHNLAELYRAWGKYAPAEALFKEVLEGRTAALGADHPDTLHTKNNLAVLYGSQGKFAPAEALLKEVLEVQTAKLGADHPDTLITKHNLACMYQSRGAFGPAEALYKEVLEVQIAKLGADHPGTLVTKNNLAAVYQFRGKYAPAEALFKEVLEVQTAKLGASHPGTLTTKHNLASLLQIQGKYAPAEALFKEVLEGRTATLGADHPETLMTKGNLAALYWSMKRLDRAIPLSEEIVKQRKETQGVGHPDTLSALASLGVKYRDAGRLDDGIRCFEEALAATRKVSGPIPADLAWVPGTLAHTYDLAKQYTKSEPLYREFVQQGQKHYGAADPRTAGLMALLGQNLLLQKKHADAETTLRDCVAVREKKQPDEWTTFNTKSMLGEALLGQKKYADAEPLLTDGYEGMHKRRDQIPEAVRQLRLTEALERLVRLYEAIGEKDKADQWRKKLDEAKAPAKPADKP